MISKIINHAASLTSINKTLQEEVEEFRTLKKEINKARCVIEFSSDGIITAINDNCLKSLKYDEVDLLGKHHRNLLAREDSTSSEYSNFWDNLSNGITQSGSFKLITKEGKVAWMQGYYAPVRNSKNQLRKVVVYLTDITATNNNLHLLQAEDEALNLSFGVVECSMDMNIIECNDLFANPLGYSQDELIGKSITTIVSPDVLNSKGYKELWESLARGERQVTQIKRISKSGAEFWYQGTYSPIKSPEGKPFKVIIYSVDINEEKNRNANYEGQIQAIRRAQIVVEMDMKGTITNVNSIFCDKTGYTKEEIVGQQYSALLTEKEKNSSDYKGLWGKLSAGETVSGEFKRIGKAGKEVWLNSNYNPILDLNRKPFKVVIYGTEITQIKKERADNEGQLSAIDRALGKVEFSLDGNITKVNRSFLDQTGYSESEIIGKHHSTLMSKDSYNSTKNKQLWEKLSSGQFESGIYEICGKHNKKVWMQASYNPILDENGIPYKVVKFAIDISQQKLSETALAVAVAETKKVIEEAQFGDLRTRVSTEDKTGEVAELCKGVNAILEKMTDVVKQVKEAGETINTAASEIAMGNNDLSSRTEQQTSSLEETASSMEELAATVKQNADNAKQANKLATDASGIAVKGGEVVSQVVKTMSAINESAQKIEDIISVIDGIAFQTNILALNAAVEAARAGEQGRGFAVVAGEVRNLAQRSAIAAKEIKELIIDSVAKTSEGTVQVEQAGKTMQEIVTSVQSVTDIMGEIASASVEQSSGINQVNQAIASMDEVTQQNAALVEEAAAAAESLVVQASSLMTTVSSFKLSDLNSRKVTRTEDKRSSHSPMRGSSQTDFGNNSSIEKIKYA